MINLHTMLPPPFLIFQIPLQGMQSKFTSPLGLNYGNMLNMNRSYSIFSFEWKKSKKLTYNKIFLHLLRLKKETNTININLSQSAWAILICLIPSRRIFHILGPKKNYCQCRGTLYGLKVLWNHCTASYYDQTLFNEQKFLVILT